MPSVSSSSRPKVLLSSTVMTPSLPTLSIASAIISPIAGRRRRSRRWRRSAPWSRPPWRSRAAAADTASTAFSMPRLRAIGLAPAATLRRPSRTSAWASTVAVVVPSPATSSVFLATSLTSSAPIFSYGSSSSISLAMDTPSLVMVGAPHFFSRTTLRPLRAERHLDGVGEGVHAALETAAGLLVERDDLGHAVLFPPRDAWVVEPAGARDGRTGTRRSCPAGHRPSPHRPKAGSSRVVAGRWC